MYNLIKNDKKIKEITKETYPFGKSGYTIKTEKTKKKNIGSKEIAKVFTLQLDKDSALWHALNFFKYSFECRGMNFTDIAYLRVYQVSDKGLKYSRRKTKWADAKKFDMKHSKQAQKIIDYYIAGKQPEDFVFPIISDFYYLTTSIRNKDLELKNKKLFAKKMQTRLQNYTKNLGKISKKASLKSNISIYVGRHSFFSIALKNGVSKSVISELAGHADYRTTETYLEGFDKEQLDVNAQVVTDSIESFLQKEKKDDSLSHFLKLKETNESISVYAFLNKIIEETDNIDTTPILLAVLQQTDCNDGAIAQKYINTYLEQKKAS